MSRTRIIRTPAVEAINTVLPQRMPNQGPGSISLNLPVLFEHASYSYVGCDEYYVRIGEQWLWMGLVADKDDDPCHPTLIHFVFARTSEEVGEHLLRLYSGFKDCAIEIKKAKVHRPGLQFET